MASVKVVIDSRKDKQGRSGVYIRFIVDRRVVRRKLLSLQARYFIKAQGRVKTTHTNHVEVNQILSDAQSKAEEYILKCQAKGIAIDAESYFDGMTSGMLLTNAISHYGDILRLEGSYRTYKKYMSVNRKITRDVAVERVDVSWMDKHKGRLKSIGNKPNTIGKDLSIIKAVINKLLRDGVIETNRIAHYKIPRETSFKHKLTMDEFRRLQSTNMPNGPIDLARDVFCFAVLQRGARVHDVVTLTPDQIRSGRLFIRAGKTNKAIEMQLTDAGRAILSKWRSLPYCFPVLPKQYDNHEKLLDAVESVTAMLNINIKKACAIAEIDKHVTMHTARHTFAHIMDSSGADLGVIQSLLDHGSRRTTEIYIKSLRKSQDLDDAVSGVFDQQ